MTRAHSFDVPDRRTYFALVRAPNLTTAAADILAGFAVAGLANLAALPAVIAASVALYAGAVTLNDAFDADVDAGERPERPIPSARIAVGDAVRLGGGLLILGIALAFLAGPVSGIIATGIALLALLYNAWSKHHPLWGPLNMGLCRGLNLLLGMSVAPAALSEYAFVAALPVIYIAGITHASRGEVHGSARGPVFFALATSAIAILFLFALAGTRGFAGVLAWPYFMLFAFALAPVLWRAYRMPRPLVIRAAIKTGVLSLIILDAGVAAVYAGPWYGLMILALLPIALIAARRLDVT